MNLSHKFNPQEPNFKPIKNLMTNFFYFIHTNNHIKYKTNLIKNFIKTIHSNCYKKLLKKL